MNFLKSTIALGLFFAAPAFAEGEPTLALDLAAMPAKTIWEGHAALTPLAMRDGKPSVVVVRMPAGTTATHAHATGDGNTRILTVLSGSMFYSDGEEVDAGKETAYGPGSILLIASGTHHWLSARDNELLIMLTIVAPDDFSPPVKAQQGAQ